ncbi:MAG TPA: hypothetical protein VF283_08735 [Bryobacteraceae bacterium]
MSARLNQLFQYAPKQFLERTVLFTDQLTQPESAALMRNRISHFVDLQPLKERATARVLPAQHLYSDATLTSYFVPPGGFAIVPTDDPPYRFVFLPEFACCRLLVSRESEQLLRFQCEQGLAGSMPPPEFEPGSRYVDSFAYWDYTRGPLVGRIRATAVLVKERDAPWTVFMQQIVGTPGFEQVRLLFSRALRY